MAEGLNAWRSRLQRHGWPIACLLPLAITLGVRGPMPIDETRYLSVAWEMWSRGDFLLPTLNGVPYTHKPPLLFWLMHLGWSVFGVNAWWPRCIPALAAIVATWQLRRLTRRLYPEDDGRVADIAAWLMAGTVAVTAFSTLLLFDLLLVACVVTAIAAMERADRAPVGAWPVWAIAVAAGLLSKGPAMLVFALPPVLAAPWWSAEAARAPRRWYGGLVAALLAALALAGLWVMAAWMQAGDAFVRTILWEQSATRIVHSFAHAEPWWFYVLLFPLLLFPWLLWPTAWRSLGARGHPRGDRLVIATFVPAFVAFSLISGKQVQYLLPLVPFAALWLAPRVSRAGMLAGGTTPGVVLTVIGAVIVATALWLEPAGMRLATGLTVIVCASMFVHSPTDRFAAVRRLALATSVGISLLAIAFYSTTGETYRLERTAAVVRDLDSRGVPIAWMGPYDGQFNFLARLRRPLATFESAGTDAIEKWIAANPDGVVMTYSRDPRDGDLHSGIYRQRYRSGWLAVVPASEAHLAARMAQRFGPEED